MTEICRWCQDRGCVVCGRTLTQNIEAANRVIAEKRAEAALHQEAREEARRILARGIAYRDELNLIALGVLRGRELERERAAVAELPRLAQSDRFELIDFSE